MRRDRIHRAVPPIALLTLWLVGVPGLVFAAPPGDATSPRKETVKKYFANCRGAGAKDTACEKIRKEAVDILKESLLTLGSTADRAHVPLIFVMFKSEDPELRIEAANAIGMIGPQDQDLDLIVPLTNDPVPDVRHAVSNMLSHGKGNAIALLKQRVMPMRTGHAPDKPVDAVKFGLPIEPDSVYLFDASDASVGRLSYVAKGKSDPGQFYRAKAKKGPFPLQEFKDKYRYQLQDEDEAMRLVQEAKGKEIEGTQPPDPTNVEAFAEYMQKVASIGAAHGARAALDFYEPKLFGIPTVYVLEERQIGQRSYPTRYVVLYQELAFKRPGYRLSWTTVSDDLIKTAQATSLAEEKEELANKKEAEVVRKRQEALDDLTKKKDAAEKKQFKKGQEDLEKELGF